MPLPPPDKKSAALVTGASAGMGVEYARQLAGRGHNVILVARRLERLDELAREIRSLGVRAETVETDLTKAAARKRMLAAVKATELDVEVLVNNAGFGYHGLFHKTSLERHLELVKLNMEALVHLTGVFLPRMVSRGRGAVINMASTAGFQPTPYEASYAASKAFVLSFSQALHSEVGPQGVEVLAVSPGPVPSEWQEVAGFAMDKRLPLAVSPAEVVREALDWADGDRRHLVPGRIARLVFKSVRALPTSLKLPITKRLMKP